MTTANKTWGNREGKGERVEEDPRRGFREEQQEEEHEEQKEERNEGGIS